MITVPGPGLPGGDEAVKAEQTAETKGPEGMEVTLALDWARGSAGHQQKQKWRVAAPASHAKARPVEVPRDASM